jgi:hypothetical protein
MTTINVRMREWRKAIHITQDRLNAELHRVCKQARTARNRARAWAFVEQRQRIEFKN